MRLQQIFCIYLVGCLSFVSQRGLSQATIAPQFLCVETLVGGNVQLNWEPSTESCGAFTNYSIWASTVFAGPYALLTTISTEATDTYTHVGADGSLVTWYYYIEAIYSCAGYTISITDTLDNLDPIAPILDYVTVTSAGARLFWLPSVSPETFAYIIYRDNIGFVAIDTVYGRFTTTYLDGTSTPSLKVETYTIAAMDSCENVGPFSIETHHTILLTDSLVICTDTIFLFWNPYDTWAAGVSNYEIWVDDAGAGSILEVTLPNTASSYIYQGAAFDDGFINALTIKAVRSDNTVVSESNSRGYIIDYAQPAEYNVMRNATVTSSNQIAVQCYPDQSADIESIAVKRSADGFTFTTIYTENPPSIPFIFNYLDESVSASSASYYYKFSTSDGCFITKESGIVRSVFLSGISNSNFTNSISWNNFEMLNATLIESNIYRNDGTASVLIATMLPSQTSFTDDVTAFLNSVSEFCYSLEVIYSLNAPENGIVEQLSSLSNTICLEQAAKIYIPNAIAPEGINNVFKPIIIYGEQSGYLLQIFDRYGQVIFESNTIDQGWNGTFNNQIVAMGSYTYLIQFTASNGDQVLEKGTVTVIR